MRVEPSSATDSSGVTRVFIELPGVPMEALEVSIEDESVTVRGKTSVPDLTGFDALHLSEFATDVDYERSFNISSEVEADAIEAEYRNGVLELRLPRRRPKKRAIQIG